MSEQRNLGFETRMLHAGHAPDAATNSRAVPIYQTTSFTFNDTDHAANLFGLKEFGNIYTRIMNPTTGVFEERMASLEGAVAGLAAASGMSAIFMALMTLLEPGDEIVTSAHLYGGTYTQFEHTVSKLGLKVHFVDPTNIDNWAAAITPKTRLLYGETIGNPEGSILDIAAVADLAHSKGMPLMIDNTMATPYLCNPIAHGADIVIHSATKFIGGHGNSIGGVLLEAGTFDYSNYRTIAEPSAAYHGLNFMETFGGLAFMLRARTEVLRDTGACLSPFNAFMLIQGLETLSVRMDRHVQNAQAVAEFLQAHPQVSWVKYAGLLGNEYHAMAQKYTPKGPGAVFSFALNAEGDAAREKGKKFIDATQIFSHLANIGDARSLIIHPASTTHSQLSDAELAKAGVGPGMIRLSVGMETTDDLIYDLEQAFAAI